MPNAASTGSSSPPFAGAFVPLALSAPLIAAAEDYSTTFWSLPSWTSAVRFYPDSLLDRELAVGIGIVLSVAALVAWRSSRGPARRAGRASFGHRTTSWPRWWP